MVDYDRAFDFSRCKTFAWSDEGTPAGNELNQRRIETAVVAELGAQGLTEADEPDLIVVTHIVVDRQAKSRARVGIGVGKSVSWGGISVGGSRPVGSKTVENAVLVIELIDPASGNLVWEARANGAITGASPGKLEKKIYKAVSKAFKKYPN
jgi:hypothetical protein